MKCSFSDGALIEYQRLIKEKLESYGEGNCWGVYDFARCVRPDGTTYGTRGKCIPPNKPAAEAPEPPQSMEPEPLPKNKKVKVSMGGYSTEVNVNTRELP